MKPTATGIKVHSTMDGERKAMSIDTAALQHIMSVLTDLYADPPMAVVREYSTNGYDAIIEAGVNEPLRVTSPTSLSPSLVIQDFGVGMSTDTILNRYSMYGHSTKRETNEQVGMLGVGCKSGLTYASSFTVKSIHNGIETLAMVSRNTQGVGEIQIIDTKATNARTGTTITIPVHDVQQMREKIVRFFSYWTPGTVLVDGKVPDAFDLGDGWFVNRDRTVFYSPMGHANAVVVMGNVPYRLENDKIIGEYRSALGYNGSLVVFAPIGSVAFAPSREELSYSGPTLTFLNELMVRIEDMKISLIDDTMKAATTKGEAIASAIRLNELPFLDLSKTPAVWNGNVVPHSANPFRSQDVIYWSTEAPGWGSKPWNNATRNPWGWMTVGARVVINSPDTISAAIKHRIKQKYGAKAGFYFVTNDGADLPYHGWVDTEEWSDFLANLPKLPKAAKAANAATGGWVSTAVNDGREWLGDKSFGNVVDGKGKYVIIDTETLNGLQDTYSSRTLRIKAEALGYTLVRVYARSQAAFVEMAAEAITKAEFDKVFQGEVAKITKDERNALWMIASIESYIPTSKWSKLLDNRFTDLLESVKNVNEGVWHADGSRSGGMKDNWIDRDYPLLDSYHINETQRIEYVNALYTYRSGKDAQ